jgi:hypothetical protein
LTDSSKDEWRPYTTTSGARSRTIAPLREDVLKRAFFSDFDAKAARRAQNKALVANTAEAQRSPISRVTLRASSGSGAGRCEPLG